VKTITEINHDLAATTIVNRFEFVSDHGTRRCSVLIELVDNNINPRIKTTLKATKVSGLRIEGFGGGVTQVMTLRATDIRILQHDEVNFELQDLDDHKLLLRCESLVTEVVPIG
jgi:hypothetical protein